MSLANSAFMNVSRADWCKRFADALAVLDEATERSEAEWLAQAAYPSAQLLDPEHAAARLVGGVLPDKSSVDLSRPSVQPPGPPKSPGGSSSK